MAASGGSSTSTRAFAQKLNKNQGAAEVRRNVSTVFVSQNSHRSSTGSSFIHLVSGTVPLTEVVDPLDFEEFILQSQPLNDNEPESSMLEFPDDDIEVTTIPRHCRTVQPSIPTDLGFDSDPHLKDCIHTYTADWSIVNRRYQFQCSGESKPDSRRKIRHSRSFTETLPRHVYEVDDKFKTADQDKEDERSQDDEAQPQNDLPKGSWASSIFDLQSSQPDDLLPTLLDRMPPEDVDVANREQRTLSRSDSCLSIYPVQQEEGIERRAPATIPQEHFGQRVLVKCLQLKLEIEVEPIFASMALYDLRVKKKISENFYFDMNPEWCRKLLKETTPRTDISTLTRSAIFSITYPSTDVFLVIKLEKILQQGDISEIAEPYMKDTENPKQREKVRSSVLGSVDRLGKYRMPFAWTAIHLIDIISGAATAETVATNEKDIAAGATPGGRKVSNESVVTAKPGKRAESFPRSTNMADQRKSFHGSYMVEPAEFESLPDLTKFRPVTLTVSSFFKQESDKLKDEDLYKFLADIKRPSSVLKRLKCIPGTLKLDISPPGDKPPYCLTSELQQVVPYPDGQGRPTKEIEEFAPKEVYSPFLTYKNLLYIYPLSVNFSSRGGSARNIAIKIQFMAAEDIHSVVECILGKSSCSALSTEAWVPVTYHNRSPDFYEEIKVKIPPHLTEQHHILFSFYHISCIPGKKPDVKDTVETPVGYTWIPALKDGRLSLGEFHLPVSVDKPPQGYSVLSPEVQLPGMKWVEGHKGVFHVAVRAVSSIHSQDHHIHKFLKMCHQIEGRLLSPSRNTEGNVEVALRRSIMDLGKCREEPLVRFLHVILDKLILLLVRPPVISGTVVNIGQTAFEALAQIVKRVHELFLKQFEYFQDEHNRNNLLSSYVTYVFCAPYSPSPASTPIFPGDNRPVSMAVGSTLTAPMHSKASLSNSNPQLNASTQAEGQAAQTPGWDTDKTKGGGDVTNIPGNRNSMAETRVGAVNIPGLTSSNKRSVHEELALQWAVANTPVREVAMKHAWFFFELMVKSMAQHLDNTDRFFLPRKSRFPEQFLDDLRALVNTTISEVVNKNNDFNFAQDLNSSLGFFLYDLLSLVDRGFVFDLVKHYCKEMLYQGGLHAGLAQLRLELLRIVSSHEHYVTLNLPFPTALYPSEPSSPTTSMSSLSSTSGDTLTPANSMAELSVAFRQQHFLVGLLQSELTLALEGSEFALQCQAIDTIRDLLACHDSDTRYDDIVCRSRVAALYLPLLGIVIDTLPQLYGYRGEEAEGLNPDVAMAIATSSISSRYETRPELASQLSKPQQLTQESTRNLLMGFLWVLKNMDPGVLKLWWSDQEPPRLGLLLDVLHMCITQFEYNGKKELRQKSTTAAPRGKPVSDKKKLEEMLLGQTGAAHEMKQRHSRNIGQSPGNMEPKLRWRKDMTQWRQAIDMQEKVCPEVAISSQIEGALCAEVNMIVLDTLELIVQTVSVSDSLRVILSGVLRVLLHCLNSNQCVEVVENIFNTQRSIVSKFPELLFEEETELCADLCSRLLNHCSSSIGNVRSQASASLYLLMRQNFEQNRGVNFARVKMQVTMSLSTLVGTSHAFSEEYLRRSLKTIITYAEADYELKTTTFPEQVRELVFNLHMILTDTVKMKEFQEDPEMLVDLMYRIAKGYQNSPDLRLTWLNNMASKHSELNNKVEAALCVVHAAGLVAEYLTMIEDKRYLPIGCVAFEKISPNVLEESAVSDDVVSPDEEGICTGKYFSENGLIGMLETAASTFMGAQMFECVNEVYKLLIPILETRREYKKLASVHSKLSEAFNRIIQTQGKRMMGTYFRVGFYGSKFGDLDGEEYVYKEPAITKLPEISHRLQGFYGEKFGPDNFDVIKDSDAVERDKLDPNKAYVQLTYVDPYFDEYEMKDRVTYFDKNYNLRRFMYVTPFTPSGKKRGDLANQYKRKTTLTVSNSFPYVKTRISVIHREQIVLNPIEVAIEDMQNRSNELVSAIRQKPPDAKMLQMVLQGSIGTTVNQGPLEIANVFLYSEEEGDEDNDCQPPDYSRHHHKLRLAFKEFMKRCGDALHLNKALIKTDQRAYQKELERNYHQLVNQLEPFLKNRFGSLRGSIRKKEGSALLRKISMSFNAQHSVA